MTEKRTDERAGPFWDFVAGRLPAPPAARTLGFRLEDIDADAGVIRVSFEARPEFANPVGNVQGGFLAAMLDDSMGPALSAVLAPDQFGTTLELKVSYLRPARPGRIHGTGRVLHRGGSIAFLEGSLSDEQGNLLATATATARIIRADFSGMRSPGNGSAPAGGEGPAA